MPKHVYSTLAADNRYTGWRDHNGIKTAVHEVLIRGGAGVARLSKSGEDPHTPEGLRTEVSDDDFAILKDNHEFRAHMERGFIKVLDTPRDPDTVAQKMEEDKGGAPKTEADVKADAAEQAKKSGLTPDETLSVKTGAAAKAK